MIRIKIGKTLKSLARAASLEEIRENDYNLNIPRYVDTFEEEKLIDLKSIVNELEIIEEEIKLADLEIEKYCKELGINAPILR